MKLKKSSFWSKIPNWVWLFISILVAACVWVVASNAASLVFASPAKTFGRFMEKAMDGTLWGHVSISLFRVVIGFGLAFVASIPVAFLMVWYDPFRHVVEPWIQFVRNIPPLAYITLVIVGAGVGEPSKIIVLFIACFLTMVVTIFQGVKGVDPTLLKAARVLGAGERDIFFHVVIPASTPFILVAARLGLSVALTTLIAAELTGASKGLGTMIQRAGGTLDMGTVLMGIIVIGVIGLTFEQGVKFLERRLTGWQETAGQ
ncbi:MAG: ABC transporter permease [Oscillibacter sp.]